VFIYEYISDVVSDLSPFIKRMREYVEEDIEHFYFMIPRKDEVSEPTSVGSVLWMQLAAFTLSSVTTILISAARSFKIHVYGIASPMLPTRPS
jgi:hypothetical protein